MSIIHISDDIKKEFKLTSEGVAVVSVRGAARIADIAEVTLRDHFKSASASINRTKLVKMLVAAGFEVRVLKGFSQLGIPDTALAIILEYYTFEAKDSCTLQAKLAYRSFSAIGIRTWVQSELGYCTNVARF